MDAIGRLNSARAYLKSIGVGKDRRALNIDEVTLERKCATSAMCQRNTIKRTEYSHVSTSAHMASKAS